MHLQAGERERELAGTNRTFHRTGKHKIDSLKANPRLYTVWKDARVFLRRVYSVSGAPTAKFFGPLLKGGTSPEACSGEPLVHQPYEVKPNSPLTRLNHHCSGPTGSRAHTSVQGPINKARPGLNKRSV